jgi:gliding motility-associated-like protein
MKKGVLPDLVGKILLLLLICASSITVAQNQVAKKTPKGTWYYEYVPPDYNSNTNKYPIVFFLHGMGEKGNTETDLVNVAKAGPPKHVKNGFKFPFILISPQLKTNYSGWPNTYIDEVIEHCKTDLRVDLSRIYLTGLSLGGGGVWQYSQEPAFGQKLAAIAPVCGSGNNTGKACNFGITNLPVWAFHGDADNVVVVSKTINMVNAINACTPAPDPLAKMTIYPGVTHNSWDRAYLTDNSLHTPNVYQWLMQFKNGTAVANAGADKTIYLPTNSTTIAGSATVENATITSYTWTKTSGSGGTMTNTTSPTLTLTNLPEGIFVYKLVVKASNGEMAQDDVTVTVIGSNKAPVANAGSDITLTLPTNSVTINGTGTDTDGTITAYKWTKVSGPGVTASGTSTATLKLSSMVAGTYVYSLQVTDNIGATGTDEVKIVVNNTAVNQLPVVNAGSDKTINLPTNTTNITATASDADGSITNYLWEKVSGPAVTMTNTSAATVNLSALLAGVYVFRITVTDNAGGKGSDEVKVTVLAANQAPVANAGADINITLPTNSTNIIGSGSDADGSITTYAWTVVSGPNIPTLLNSAAATVSVSSLVEGTYTLRLTVTDNSSATSSDEVKIIVNPAVVNVPPVANAGGDKTINLPTNSTSLTGSGSDTDGSIASYSWTKTSGPAVTIANATSPTLLLSNLVAGVYKFQLTVTDNSGATATDIATVTVVAANQSPVANAGSDISITLPTNTANLTGSGSDPDGTIGSYLWEKVSGPNATLSNETTTTVTLSDLVEGVYVFSLTVTDDKGFTDSDEVTVTVNAMPVNETPSANAGADQSITLPQSSVVFNGSGSDTDGTISSYAWTLVSGPACTLANQNTPSLSVSNLVAGSYTFRLKVTDNQGATDTDDVTLTVQPETVNQSPVADAGGDVTLILPANSTTITGAASDPDGTVASYSWTKTSGPAATISGETTPTLNLSNLLEGVYTFQLTVTDDKGSTGSDVVTVTVNQTNSAPAANAGADITINLPTNSTTINGSGTDADGTVTGYAWVQTSGPSTATLAGETTASLTASDLGAGTYIFTLTVTDNDGATATDEVKVIVNDINLAPTANAGNGRTITLPTKTASYPGSGTDADGTIVGYQWTQVSGPATATLTNANTKTLTVVTDVPGTYYFRLTVTDNDGATGYDDVRLTVNAAVVNQVPTANAGSNQTITLPVNSINLTGSGTDPDGTIATYLWTKVSGPAATMTNVNTPTVSLSALTDGSYVFRLTVTDNSGATASADVTVTVLPEVVNASPTANAGSDKTLTLPTNSTNIVGSGTDADGTIVGYSWSQVSGPIATISNATLPTISIADLIAGTYVFRLTVTDDKGATGTDDVTITVNNAVVNQAPVANAGPDRTITLPVNSLIMTGTGTDADGSITAYLWTKVSGPAATMTGTSTTTLNLANLVEGTYVFRLRVTDNSGATKTDDVKVTVLAAAINQSPVANAGSDKTITLPLDFITIFGSGSDPDGTVTSYLWTKVSGPAATLQNEATATLSATALVAGTYVFRLTVTDDKGTIDSDDMTVVVNPIATNEVPVANAGTDQTITLPTSIANLPGSGSDADGAIVKYTWLKVSGPSVTLGATNTANLSISDLLEGVYTFRLTVEDDKGATDSDDVTVTVLPATTNIAPVVTAGTDVTIFEPATSATLNGNASDSDGSLSSIVWTQVSGATATIVTPNTFFTQITGLTPGTYRFRLTVTDDKSATSFDEVSVIVEPATANQPPVANAGTDKTIKLPANSINLTGSATDIDGTISTYQWQILSGPSATVSGETTLTVALTNMLEGIYSIRLTVTDDDGATDDDVVQVTVLPASINLPPSVDAGGDQSIQLPDNSITVTGSFTDDAPATVTLLWEIVDGPAATLTNADQNSVTISNLLEGTYTLRLTATDAGSLTGSDEMVITVLPAVLPPDPPTVNAGNDIEVQLPVNTVSLTASAEAPDGLIVSYEWQQTSGSPIMIDPTDSSTIELKNLLPGTYRLSVKVIDNEGREASDDVTVTVLADDGPANLFSPDNNGNNDTWVVAQDGTLDDCEINVYDRQGRKVFSSIGYPVPWDGTFNGSPVPDGAYYYVIRCDGKISKTGSVTIARMK